MADGTKIAALTELEAAYIAGLIDGEGSIYVMRHNGRNGLTFYPAVSIAMTTKPVLEWFAQRVDVVVSIVPRKPDGWRDQFMVRIHGKKAIELARRMAPFLKVKHRQAALLQVFPVDQRLGPGVLLADGIRAERARLREEINGLNARGTPIHDQQKGCRP